MRFLSLSLWFVLLTAPAAHSQQIQTNAEVPDGQIDQLQALLTTAQRAYGAGDIDTGYDRAEAALSLAKDMEPPLLQAPRSASERLARANLLLELGRTARIQDEDADARRYLETSLELYESSSGVQQPKLADVLISLGGLAYERGELDTWQALMHRALENRMEVFGKYHPKVAEVLGILGTEKEQSGELAAAEDYFRRAVTSLKKSQPPTDLDLGFAYLNLARVLRARGEAETAAQVERRGREILRQNRP